MRLCRLNAKCRSHEGCVLLKGKFVCFYIFHTVWRFSWKSLPDIALLLTVWKPSMCISDTKRKKGALLRRVVEGKNSLFLYILHTVWRSFSWKSLPGIALPLHGLKAFCVHQRHEAEKGALLRCVVEGENSFFLYIYIFHTVWRSFSWKSLPDIALLLTVWKPSMCISGTKRKKGPSCVVLLKGKIVFFYIYFPYRMT